MVGRTFSIRPAMEDEKVGPYAVRQEIEQVGG